MDGFTNQLGQYAIDTYNHTLQSGFAGLALVVAIGMVLLIIAAIIGLRYLSRQDKSAAKSAAQAQENIHDLIELQRNQQTLSRNQQAILERITIASEDTNKNLQVNNELKQKQADAFAAQESQLKAIHTSLQEWPKAYTSAVQNLTDTFKDLKAYVEAAFTERATNEAAMRIVVQEIEVKIDGLITQVTEALSRLDDPAPLMPLALQPDKVEDKEAKPE